MANAFSEWVGTYRLVVSTELLGFIERAFVAPAPASQREAVRAEALAEAGSARLEIDDDGQLSSHALGRELYRVLLPTPSAAARELAFEKGPDQPVTLCLLDRDTLLATQPGKPPATFQRLK